MPRTFSILTYVIGYTYDADIHCVDCTARNTAGIGHQHAKAFTECQPDGYGVCELVIDLEGNELGVIFPDTEFDYTPTCADCGEEINLVCRPVNRHH